MDVLSGSFVDMIQAGIINPAKVTKGALQNAASVPAMVLSTDALIANIPEHRQLLLNCADALTLGDDLVYVRSNKPIDRVIDQPEASTRTWWKFLCGGLMNIIVAAAGLSRWFGVRGARRRYRAGLAKPGVAKADTAGKEDA